MSIEITASSATVYTSNFNSNVRRNPTHNKPRNFRTTKSIDATDQPKKLFLIFGQKHGVSCAMKNDASDNSQPRASSSQDTSPKSQWKKWLLGIVLSVVLPAAGHKGGLILALKGKIDQTLATVESVTEIVEEIAEEADKIVEEVEERLPGDSKLKETLKSFDDHTKVAVKQARMAEDLIHKVKDTEDQIAAVLIDNNKEKPLK